MARYRVMHFYASSTYGPWSEGDFVDLEEDAAAWVNHDSPGTLQEVDPEVQAAEKAAAKAAAVAALEKKLEATSSKGRGRRRKAAPSEPASE